MSECSRFASIEDIQSATIIGLYPNPSQNTITIQVIGENLSTEPWVFVSSEGKVTQLSPNVVQSPSGSFLLVFDIEKLPSGKYTVSYPGKVREWAMGFVKYD
jgi:hypothetical protein